MATVATTTRPTMTEPGSDDRLVSLQRSRRTAPTSHAVAAKILTAGLSTSMVLGLVAALAHSTMQQEAADAAAARAEAAKEAASAATSTTTVVVLTAPPHGPHGFEHPRLGRR